MDHMQKQKNEIQSKISGDIEKDDISGGKTLFSQHFLQQT